MKAAISMPSAFGDGAYAACCSGGGKGAGVGTGDWCSGSLFICLSSTVQLATVRRMALAHNPSDTGVCLARGRVSKNTRPADYSRGALISHLFSPAGLHTILLCTRQAINSCRWRRVSKNTAPAVEKFERRIDDIEESPQCYQHSEARYSAVTPAAGLRLNVGLYSQQMPCAVLGGC